MRHPLRRIATQGAWYAASSALSKLGGLVLLPLYTNTRYLEVADFGRWGVFEITVPLAVAIFGLTLPVGLVRFYAEPDGGRKVAGTTWWITVGITLAVSLPAFVLVGAFAPEASRALYRLLITYIAFELLLGVPLSVFRAKEQAWRYALVLALKLGLVVVLNLYWLVHERGGLEGMMRAYTAASGLSLLIAFVFVAEPWALVPRVHRAAAWRVLRFSAPLVIAGLGSVLLNAGDRYVLALYRPDEEVGLYTLAAKFGGLVNMLFAQPLVLAWLPLLVRLEEGQRSEVLRQLVRHSGLVLGLVVTGVCLFAPPLLLLMGSSPAYRSAIPLIPWIGFGFAAFGLSVLFYGVLALFERTRTASAWILAAALLNLGLNFALVPSLGALGSALSTLIAYLFLLAGQFASSQKLVPCVCPWAQVLGVWILSAALSTLAVLMPVSLSFWNWAERAALLGIWAAVVSLTRWFTWRELREIIRVMRPGR